MATILVVDDDSDVVRLISDILKGRGHQPIIARDGADALLRAEELGPSLIVLDRELPRIDGLETCRRLRANDSTRAIPVLMLTASVVDIEQVTAPGAPDAWLMRPFLRELFIDNVDRLLSAAPRGATPVL